MFGSVQLCDNGMGMFRGHVDEGVAIPNIHRAYHASRQPHLSSERLRDRVARHTWVWLPCWLPCDARATRLFRHDVALLNIHFQRHVTHLGNLPASFR